MTENPENKKSSTGMEENLAALLSYILTPITGIIFYLIEKDSKFVKFHAMQSLLFGIIVNILYFVLKLIPILGWFLSFIVSIAAVVFWIIAMVKSFKNEWYKMPIIGDIAEKQVNK